MNWLEKIDLFKEAVLAYHPGSKTLAKWRTFYLFYVIHRWVLQTVKDSCGEDCTAISAANCVHNLAIRRLIEGSWREQLLRWKMVHGDRVGDVFKMYEIDDGSARREFDELYDSCFIRENIYLSVYFNNLIKYFLPLPAELLEWSPLITYRKGVDRLWKRGGADYLSIPTEFDGKPRYIGKKNIDQVANEIDIHIPLEYFAPDNEKNWQKRRMGHDVVNLVAVRPHGATWHDLYICNRIMTGTSGAKGDKKWILQPSWHRRYDRYDSNMFSKGLGLEFMSKSWKKLESEVANIEVLENEVVYVSVMRRFTMADLVHVFDTLPISHNELPYLYHNTGLAHKSLYHWQQALAKPAFFLALPLHYGSDYMERRDCIIYEMGKTGDAKLLDLTRTFLNSSAPPKSGPDVRDPRNWYAGERSAKLRGNIYRCLGKQVDRQKCDTGHKSLYVGRRKLQEILYKTRRYDAGSIWMHPVHGKEYKRYGWNGKSYWHKECYYPGPWHPVYDLDTAILEKLAVKQSPDMDIAGFFFTDYADALEAGEVWLLEPAKYLHPRYLKKGKCHEKGEIVEI
jgi:hypothetical protein